MGFAIKGFVLMGFDCSKCDEQFDNRRKESTKIRHIEFSADQRKSRARAYSAIKGCRRHVTETRRFICPPVQSMNSSWISTINARLYRPRNGALCDEYNRQRQMTGIIEITAGLILFRLWRTPQARALYLCSVFAYNGSVSNVYRV